MVTKNLSFAIQMNPVAGIDIAGDSTFALGLEALSRGHDLWYYTPDKLSFHEGKIIARGQSLELFDIFDACLLYTSPSPRDLSTSRMPSSA